MGMGHIVHSYWPIRDRQRMFLLDIHLNAFNRFVLSTTSAMHW